MYKSFFSIKRMGPDIERTGGAVVSINTYVKLCVKTAQLP